MKLFIDELLKFFTDIGGILFLVFIDNTIKNIINTEQQLNDVKYFGLENIPSKNGYIIISNHSCTFDYTIIKKIINCYCVAAISQSIRLTLNNIDLLNDYKLIAYDYTPEEGVKIKQQIIDLINQESNILVFPEGYSVRLKSKNERILKPFKKGLFYLAYENKISILPISQNHYNNNNISYFDSQIFNAVYNIPPFNLKVDVKVHKLIHPEDYSTFDEFYEKCFETIKSELF